ncbi:putative Aminodeoxychorismate lyase [Nitrospina gracilis 3/211]|uniref:branched-chain-amino-acid transaminase n=2 Tax=Nitrospinaceae TaxID=407032 RepID=M1Z0Q2_NITG3|nr:putative Aminodeoxychorismate lyase [Nitrospina gracilis 3/211]
MTPVVYINGRFVPQEEARVSVFDRGFLYGDVVFETLRAYRGRIFRLADHLDRLHQSAGQIHLTVPKAADKLESLLYEVLQRNELYDAILRLTLSRGESTGFDIVPDAPPTLVITARPVEPLPDSRYREGVSILLVSDSAPRLPGVTRQAKSGNFLPYILARHMALEAGHWDAILLNHRGEVCDASTSNVFIVRGGVLKTPPVGESVLAGITRKVVLELAQQPVVAACEETLQAADLHQADEVFLTNTGIELLPVTRVDDTVIGNGRRGPITARLHAAFLKSIESL